MINFNSSCELVESTFVCPTEMNKKRKVTKSSKMSSNNSIDKGNLNLKNPYIKKIINLNSLGDDVIKKIFSLMKANDVINCAQVNKAWNILANQDSVWKSVAPPSIAFGKKHWELYFGDVGEEPPLSKEIFHLFESECPFSPGKKIKETHMLALIPKKINGKRVNIRTLMELAPFNGIETNYLNDIINIQDFFLSQYDDFFVSESHWVLMKKDLFEGKATLHIQKSKIRKFNKEKGTDYTIPSVLDALVCILVHYAVNKEYLYNSSICSKGRAKDEVIISFYPSSNKLYLRRNYVGCLNYGLAPIKNLTS